MVFGKPENHVIFSECMMGATNASCQRLPPNLMQFSRVRTLRFLRSPIVSGKPKNMLILANVAWVLHSMFSKRSTGATLRFLLRNPPLSFIGASNDYLSNLCNAPSSNFEDS